MLLPAFPCDHHAATAMRQQRPKLQSFTSFTPHLPQQQSQSEPKVSKKAHLIASCRALQSMLGNAIPSPRILSARMLTSTPKKEAANPFEIAFTSQNRRTSKRQPPPRGANKRRRSEWDDSDDEVDKENAILPHTTPKRRRRIPYDMPLGLCADDFKALEPVIEMPDTQASPSQQSDRDSGYGPSPTLSAAKYNEEWSLDEDRILVETVLEKLQLTKRAWNDCAKRLGKNKDSLGQRWKALVDEGDVGLRRGGSRQRTGLDVGSW